MTGRLRDPFSDGAGPDSLTGANRVGSKIFDLLLAHLREDGPDGLVFVIRQLDRPELEACVTSMLMDLISGGPRFAMSGPDERPEPTNDDENEVYVPLGRKQLIRIMRGMARGGEPGLIAAVRASTNVELRIAAYEPLRDAYEEQIVRRLRDVDT